MRSSNDVSVTRRLPREWVSLAAGVLAVFVSVWAVGEVADWWLPSGPALTNGDELFKRHWLGVSLTLFAILLVLPLFRKIPKLMRAAAVALLVILTSLSPIFLIHSPESLSLPTSSEVSPQDDAIATLATRFWVVIVLLLFASCAWFGWTHLRHIHKDALHYFDHFKELSRANFSGMPKEAAKWDDSQLSTLHDDAVEGESTLRLLLTIIYGIIAMSGSTIAYFITGQHLDLVGDSVPFIFANNEGFTAALSLLIIVLASAAVPIYSDLVKKIDEEATGFEHDISVLAQNINGLSIGADAIWKHFTDVGLPLFKEWQSSLDEHQNRNPEFLSEIQFKQIFLPYLIFQATRPDGIDNYDDYPPRLLDPFFPVVETLNEEGESLETLFQDSYKQLIDGIESRDHEYFFRNPDMGPTRTRVVSWLSDWHLLGTENPDTLIMEADQINRTRAIMVQAWCLEGPDRSAENHIPHKSSEHHIPPSEHILYSLLTAHDFLPSEINTNEPEHQSLRRFKSRIRRHLNEIQKTEQDQPSSDRLNRLIQQCDDLDIDASVFWDDVILFQQIAGALTSQSQSESQIRSALSRFLYYIIWYFSSFDTRTKIGTLLNRHTEGPEASTDTQAAEEGNEADNEAAVVADEATDAVAEIEAPTSAPGIRTRFEELHTHFSGDTFEEPTDKTRLTALLLADRRSALHNWIRATQAHRSRRVLLRFEAKLDEIQVYRQLGIQIIPSRSARLRHLRYLVRAPRVSRHPLRLVSTFDLPPESTSEARQRVIAADFNVRIVGNEFKQLREALGFSNNFVKYATIPNSHIRRILSTEGEAGSEQTLPTEKNLSERTRKYLEWILLAMKPDGEARNLSDKDLVSEALQHVSHRYNVLKTTSFRPDPGWQETQWNKLFDYCRDTQHQKDLKQRFFSSKNQDGTTSVRREQFGIWWRNFNIELVLPSISAEFKQLREALGFSNTFVKESFVPQSLLRAILSPNSEENQQSDSEKNRLPSRTRKYLRWILLVMEPNLDAENLTNPELVSKALRHVSREFLRFMEPENLPADGWREAQWQRLLDYCRDPQQHEDLKQRFFSIQHPDGTTQLEQERFNEWWERFNSR